MSTITAAINPIIVPILMVLPPASSNTFSRAQRRHGSIRGLIRPERVRPADGDRRAGWVGHRRAAAQEPRDAAVGDGQPAVLVVDEVARVPASPWLGRLAVVASGLLPSFSRRREQERVVFPADVGVFQVEERGFLDFIAGGFVSRSLGAHAALAQENRRGLNSPRTGVRRSCRPGCAQTPWCATGAWCRGRPSSASA